MDSANTKDIETLLNDSKELLVLDVRPFNTYSCSHLRKSHNVCIPSTLLKRRNYDVTQVMKASNMPQSVKDSTLDESKKLLVLLYDSESEDDNLSFPLYQTLLKFLRHDRFDVSYLRGGIQNVDAKLVDEGVASSLKSPVSPSTPESATADGKTLEPAESSTTSPPFLSGFTLPSASSSDHKLLMSIKKSLPKIDTDVAGHYRFRLPENFVAIKDKLPEWLSFLSESYGKPDHQKNIVEYLSEKFNRLESSEQVRLSMAIHNIDKDLESCRSIGRRLHDSEGFGTPLTLCPCCDSIDYTIPSGIELGFKNRYNNIWPYEHSRVRLVASPSTHPGKREYDDYFNANYIHFDKLSKQKYIATQNPLESTQEDFWNTIWYKGVKCIVCLDASQALTNKSYYSSDAFMEKSQLKVEIKSCEQFDDFNLREIVLIKQGVEHKIFHFEYEKWPDFGTPDELESVLHLLESKQETLSTARFGKDSWELLVHCSAGCGRTGCFITLDMVIDSFLSGVRKGKFDPWGSEDLVYKSVQFQRQQRISMVQNLDQFIFCYEGILSYLADSLLSKS